MLRFGEQLINWTLTEIAALVLKHVIIAIKVCKNDLKVFQSRHWSSSYVRLLEHRRGDLCHCLSLKGVFLWEQRNSQRLFFLARLLK